MSHVKSFTADKSLIEFWDSGSDSGGVTGVINCNYNNSKFCLLFKANRLAIKSQSKFVVY